MMYIGGLENEEQLTDEISNAGLNLCSAYVYAYVSVFVCLFTTAPDAMSLHYCASLHHLPQTFQLHCPKKVLGSLGLAVR